MKSRILAPIVLMWVFVCPGAFAAESDKAGVVTDNGQNTAADAPRDGVWVGVIEDIQHLKDTDRIELINKYEAAGLGAAAAIRAFTESSHAFFAYLWIKDSGSVGDQPKLYLITFKEANNNLNKVVVYDTIKWNVGDKIEVTKEGDSASVKVLELGELSRYAAEQEAARNK